MAWTFTRSGSGYLSGALNWTPSGGITVAFWHKTTVGGNYHRLVWLYNHSSNARLQSHIDPSQPYVYADLRNASATTNTFQLGTTTSGAWEFVAIRFNDSTDLFKVFCTSGDSAGNSDSFSWPGEALTRIRIGNSDTDESFLDGKIGYVALYEGALSDGDVALLKGGDHPEAVSSGTLAYLWDWTNSRSTLAGQVGSVTLTGSGTQSYSGADDPTVDAPPAAGGIPKTSKLTLLGVG
jgi:hypothetical protein